jgi:glycogen debranching enzyme
MKEGMAMAQQAHTNQPHTSSNKGHEDGENQMPNHGRSTMVSDIRNALTTKHNQIFMLTAENGDIAPGENGQGIYFRDTCFLNQLEIRWHGQSPIALLSNAERGDEGVFELTNNDIVLDDGQMVHKERLSLRRRYTIDDHVTMQLAIKSMAEQAIHLDFTLTADSQFDNIFTIRGDKSGKRGTIHEPTAKDNALILAYDGADDHHRTTTLSFTPPPPHMAQNSITYNLHLAPGDQQNITVIIDVADRPPTDTQHPHTPGTNKEAHDELNQVLQDIPHITTSNPILNQAIDRSITDLRMLAMVDHGDAFIAAGVPWYVALFGRDSLISAFEMLAFQPALARSTLRILARYQGTRHDDFQEEDLGKILHELRVGERANLHEVPQIPYYGTIDATPLFLLLLGEYVRWTADMALFQELREHVERALDWIAISLEHSQSGFLEYGTKSEKGLTNQGWKDSDNSIVNNDGSLARPPIAMVEVQGYIYAAWRAMAVLFQECDDTDRTHQLEQQARDLQQRFEQAYWMEDEQFYALALQRDSKPATAIASNPGQLLFTGIIPANHAKAIASRLMSKDMDTGWGVRTLSAEEKAYNPLDYQVGAVWPHDNAMIALGLRRYGLIQAMNQIFTGIFDAASHFRHHRLPEVFDGFSREDYAEPVRYPVACQPQAWAAGALPLLLQTSLGLEPDALHHTLKIHQPSLPSWLKWVEIHGVRVGQAQVDLRYQREGETTLVAVQQRQGDLVVAIEY